MTWLSRVRERMGGGLGDQSRAAQYGMAGASAGPLGAVLGWGLGRFMDGRAWSGAQADTAARQAAMSEALARSLWGEQAQSQEQAKPEASKGGGGGGGAVGGPLLSSGGGVSGWGAVGGFSGLANSPYLMQYGGNGGDPSGGRMDGGAVQTDIFGRVQHLAK